MDPGTLDYPLPPSRLELSSPATGCCRIPLKAWHRELRFRLADICPRHAELHPAINKKRGNGHGFSISRNGERDVRRDFRESLRRDDDFDDSAWLALSSLMLRLPPFVSASERASGFLPA